MRRFWTLGSRGSMISLLREEWERRWWVIDYLRDVLGDGLRIRRTVMTITCYGVVYEILSTGWRYRVTYAKKLETGV